MPLKNQLKNGSLKIVVIDYIKNAFKISVYLKLPQSHPLLKQLIELLTVYIFELSIYIYINLKCCDHCIFASLFLNLKYRTSETRKNVSYFTSRALLVLEKIKVSNFRYSSFIKIHWQKRKNTFNAFFHRGL